MTKSTPVIRSMPDTEALLSGGGDDPYLKD
jgi:hypothetical protein